jgi:BirA family biotin operon repressor/biotin-[acetyl-CoA-carboxylase] ligase
MDLARLVQLLPDVRIEYHARIDSTNNRALAIARTEPVERLRLILADQQTAGRGRGANAWWSAPGALTFSLLLPADRELPTAEWPRLSLATGLAVCEVLENIAPAALVGLKWPNDVFLNGKKICGILIETLVSPKPCVIVGMGINVNNSFHTAPPDLQATATSLVDELSFEQDRLTILAAIVKSWQRRQTELRLDVASVAASWQRYCILTGQIVSVQSAGNSRVGRCLGIDADGALLVQTESSTERLIAGTVRLA